MGLTIDYNGNKPKDDGAVTVYVSPEVGKKSWFDTKRRVIFVNGMDNSPEDHRESAWKLSTLQGCPVTGVYNKTDGKLRDLGQCITDKIQFDFAAVTGRKVFTFSDWQMLVDLGLTVVRKKYPQVTRRAYVRGIIDGNKAAAALYDLLHMPGYFLSSVPIVAHSQGNLITSNALTALALDKGMKAIEGRVVHSFGSPCRYWPDRIVHHNNLFTFDLVGFLDVRTDWSSSKVGGVMAHSFLTYMQHDPEFVINRFRTGGWGMTFNLDEEALADALVEMGANAERLHAIFLRLDDAHHADADDVAGYYLRKLFKTGQDRYLRVMAKAKPAFIKLLIKVLDEGYTTDEEQSFINKLQKLV